MNSTNLGKLLSYVVCNKESSSFRQYEKILMITKESTNFFVLSLIRICKGMLQTEVKHLKILNNGLTLLFSFL